MALTGDVEMPRDGQRVRVVMEGDAWGVTEGTFRVGERTTSHRGGQWNLIIPTSSHVVSVEILRPPVKVWDVVETVEELNALPVGTIILDHENDAWQQQDYGWRCTVDGDPDIGGYAPFTILHLPDSAA